ncbi:MAG TPA: phosphosulfolactate synthase [Actinomycetes bacterium]|nr:phosphosulfolactate synthase [Actinomycetes bacterium]
MAQIDPGFLSLPERTSKPRTTGLSHVIDKGLSRVELQSLIETAGSYIDFLKLGWGTAYVSNGVKAKVAMCREAGIHACLGGTLFEIAVHQGRLAEYVSWLHRLDIEHVEVSDGALDMPVERKQAIIRTLAREFRVIAEVGSKDPTRAVVAAEWVAEMVGDLEAGASLLIAEARESGTVGLYRADGTVREDMVQAIVDVLPTGMVVFEAPRKEQQAWFIRQLGPNVNLGNVQPYDALALETLRVGLRADTLDLFRPVDELAPRAAHKEAAHHLPPLIH